MQQSLWYFSTWACYDYEIKEAKVIEETEKQYIVQASWKQRIRKSEMSSADSLFFHSKEEAEQGLIKYLKEVIASCERRIESELKAITKHKKILKERFNVEVK